MKKTLLILLALIFAFSFTGCTEPLTAGEGEVVAGKDAGNNAVNYSFLYPATWEMVRNDGTIDLQYDCDLSDGVADYASITVSSFGLPAEYSNRPVTEYWEYHKNELEAQLSATDFVTENYDTQDKYLDDAPAIKAKYNINKVERPYVCEQIICSRYNTVYFITLTVPSEHYESVCETLNTIKNSFDFQD